METARITRKRIFKPLSVFSTYRNGTAIKKFPVHLLAECRAFIERGLYGYAREDLFSLDAHLATWLPSALRTLKVGHSYPTELTPGGWSEILEKMALGFEAHLAIVNLNYDTKDKAIETELEGTVKEGMDLFVEWFGSLWD